MIITQKLRLFTFVQKAQIKRLPATTLPIWCMCLRQNSNVSKNYDLEYLTKLDHKRLVYRVIRLQRLLNYYEHICSPLQICGKDKIRVDHPDVENIVSGKTSMRKIALKILYLGWDYTAYAWEDRMRGSGYTGHTNVVERVLLEAMVRQQLLPYFTSEKVMQLGRCGRTDQQVSGLSQVVTVRVRSNLDEGFGVWSVNNDDDEIYDDNSDVTQVRRLTTYHEEGFSNSDTSLDAKELPYIHHLNAALPIDIRVLAWSPVSKRFNPRHACNYRTYRYVFPRGTMDIDLMNKSAQKFVGTHDLRNFCKRSDENVFKSFVREIFSIKIEPLKNSTGEATDLCSATICGKSFLYKQIRMMMAILMWVGLGETQPEIIDQLLDVERTPRKPGYDTAFPVNLTLVDCGYDSDDISWRWDDKALSGAAKILAKQYSDQAIKAEVLRHMYSEVNSKLSDENLASIGPQGFVEACMLADPSKPYHFNIGDSKTVKEKQTTIKKRQVNSLLNKGKYGKAAELHNEFLEEDILDKEVEKA